MDNEKLIIRFCCPYCNKALKIARKHVGKSATCPNCRKVFKIPTESSNNQKQPSVPIQKVSSVKLSKHKLNSTTTSNFSLLHQQILEVLNENHCKYKPDDIISTESDVRQCLIQGNRMRAIGKCRVKFNCDFQTGIKIIKLIEQNLSIIEKPDKFLFPLESDKYVTFNWKTYLEIFALYILIIISGIILGGIFGLFATNDRLSTEILGKSIAISMVVGLIVCGQRIIAINIAINNLKKVGDPTAFPKLKKAMKSNNISILIDTIQIGNASERLASLKILKHMGEKAKSTIPTLLDVFFNEVSLTNEEDIRDGRCTLCGKRITGHRKKARKICNECKETNISLHDLKMEAVCVFSRIGKMAYESIPILERLIKGNNTQLKKWPQKP